MLAQVTQIESGMSYKDGKRRVRLKFPAAAGWSDAIVVPADSIGLPEGLQLDEDLVVRFERATVEDIPDTLIGDGRALR